MTYDEYVAVIIYHLNKLSREMDVFHTRDHRHLDRRVERLLQLVNHALKARQTTPAGP